MAQNSPPYLLFIGIAFIALGGFLLLSGQSAQSGQSVLTMSPESVDSILDNPFEVTYNGSEAGANLGTIQKGKTITLTYLSGKIISNTETGWSSPIWGVPQNQTDPVWTKALPYKELNTDALFIELNGQRIPFTKGNNSVSATASATGEALLKMNDSRYWENTGDARFRVVVR